MWKECAIFRYSSIGFTEENKIPFGIMIRKR